MCSYLIISIVTTSNLDIHEVNLTIISYNEYVPFVVRVLVTRRVSLVEQDLQTIAEHLSSLQCIVRFVLFNYWPRGVTSYILVYTDVSLDWVGFLSCQIYDWGEKFALGYVNGW